jgi:glycosyltransferase involved in cell wall biosynthesis
MTEELSTPLVSIVTPVLNRADTIKSCLASVAAQTYPRVEHIVIDGGSDDGTTRTLESFEASSGLRWLSEPDEGMYDAINKGLRLARGEVIAYLNSDDLYLPWTVEVALAELRAGADLVYGDLGVISRPPKKPSNAFLQFYPPFNLNYYTHVATLAQPTVLWRRTLTDEIGMFDTGYRLIGDCEYWLRAATSGATLAHIDEILAIQVEHEETLRAKHPRLLREEFARLRSHYEKDAGPAGRPRLERIKKSLSWRKSQLQMRFQIARRMPTRWPHFVQFLREFDIQVDRTRMLMFLLPAYLRPNTATWIDAEVFEEGLEALIKRHGTGIPDGPRSP